MPAGGLLSVAGLVSDSVTVTPVRDVLSRDVGFPSILRWRHDVFGGVSLILASRLASFAMPVFDSNTSPGVLVGDEP